MFQIDLSERTVWVTGGSRGIGQAICEAMARAGAKVAVGYHGNEASAAATVARIADAGGKACAVKVDVREMASCEAAVAEIEAKLGPVDVLVNSAGVIKDNLFLLLEDADWRAVLDTNLLGTVHAVKAVTRGMMMRRYGRVLNLSSVAATRGGRGQANYAATKGAIEAMTRSLAVELAPKNVTVNCIAPGVIDTDMSKDVVKLGGKEILERLLLKRLGTAEDIAGWAVFLASRHADYMTGQTVHVDGGMKMG